MIRYPRFVLFSLCLFLYTLTNYGGVRELDSEIVFRSAQSLVDHGSFVLNDVIRNVPGFGTAKGKDGNSYSIYPPLEALVLTPFVKLGELINKTDWYVKSGLPVSHYVDDAKVLEIVDGKVKQTWTSPESHLYDHALRFIASFYNSFVTALTVLILFQLLFRLTGSKTSAFLTSALYAFGTLAWPYSGTFFSEPLASLLVLVSFYFLAKIDFNSMEQKMAPAFLSGLALGLANATHLLEVLFIPFFFGYVCYCSYRKRKYRIALAWILGWIPVILLLGYFNYERFGAPLQFGHDISSFNKVHFFGPLSPLFWRALYGLLFGPGKGLFLFCPAVVIGIFCWPALHRQKPLLSILLLSSILARTSFLFFYVYWHGAFCLGPRHLVAELPLMLIPCAFWLSEKIQTGSIHSISFFLFAAWVCVFQQMYFCVGEIFSYYHMTKYLYQSRGLDVFASDYLYTNWHVSPLYRLIEYRRGPFLLQSIPYSNVTLWVVGGVISAVVICFAAVVLRRRLTTPLVPGFVKL